MRHVALAGAVLLCACGDQPSGERTAAPPASTGGTAAATGIDQAYVARVLKASAFDYAQCRREPGMGGLGGAEGAADEVIVALDSSGSMAARAGGATRMDEARRAVSAFLADLPGGARGGLAVFGDVGDNGPASKARSCSAPVRLAYRSGSLDRAGVDAAAAGLRPAGWTPLAAAINSAAAAFSVPDTKRRVLFVVSDGIESCGGDPMAAAARARSQAKVVVNVIGFDVRAAAEVRALRAVAEAGGGRYLAAGPGELLATMRSAANRAKDANTVSAANALGGMDACYRGGMTMEGEALRAIYEPDQRAGLINADTANAVSSASLKRSNAAYAEFARTNQQNYDRANAANRGIDAQVDSTPQK